MNRAKRCLFLMLAVTLCLANAACSSPSTAWDNYSLGYQDAGSPPTIIDGIKD